MWDFGVYCNNYLLSFFSILRVWGSRFNLCFYNLEKEENLIRTKNIKKPICWIYPCFCSTVETQCTGHSWILSLVTYHFTDSSSNCSQSLGRTQQQMGDREGRWIKSPCSWLRTRAFSNWSHITLANCIQRTQIVTSPNIWPLGL